MSLERHRAREFSESRPADPPARSVIGKSGLGLERATKPRGNRPRLLTIMLTAAGLLGATALVNLLVARRAERRRPPKGRFLEVNGLRLHYIEAGTGKPLLLLHGNGSTAEDFLFSGLMQACSANHRTIAFDRPGFGRSGRPRGRAYTPEEQADLLAEALAELGVNRTAVFAHSWATLVALALAIRHPNRVSCLMLASGYYFPVPRPDALFLSAPAIPVLGDLLSYTLWPLLSRLAWRPMLKRVFSPNPVPQDFARYLKPLEMRPWQLRAVAEETAAIMPAAARLSPAYDGLRAPLTVIAGEGDRIVDPEQAKELHRHVVWSRLELVPGAGHMVHHAATAQVTAAIDRATQKYG